MKFLLDTATFLWAIFDEKEKISRKALQALENPEHELFLSAASTWEIAIKYSLGKLELQDDPADWLPRTIQKIGLKPLTITHQHTLAVTHLPFHHKDPFDRLLIAQAKSENLHLLSPDEIFRKYRVSVVW